MPESLGANNLKKKLHQNWMKNYIYHPNMQLF